MKDRCLKTFQDCKTKVRMVVVNIHYDIVATCINIIMNIHARGGDDGAGDDGPDGDDGADGDDGDADGDDFKQFTKRRTMLSS